MERMKPELTTLCYVEKEDSYLMMHRIKKKNDVNQDKWIGIGGHFEEGESPEDCLLREAWEETGLTLTSWRFRGIVTFVFQPDSSSLSKQPNLTPVCEYMCLYTADGFQGELKECNEGTLEWVKKADIAKLSLWEGDKIFFRLIEENVPFFSLKLSYEGEKLKKAVLDGKNLL